MIHGGPGLDHTILLPGMDALAGRCRLVYYDQRASGKSCAELTCESINIDNFVEDLESLRKALGYKTIKLFGHSFGALLAIEYAAKYPDHITGLIIINSAPATSKGLENFYEDLSLRLKPIADQLADIETSELFKKHDEGTVNSHLKLLFRGYFFDPAKCDLLNVSLSKSHAAAVYVIQGLMESDYLNDYDLRDKLSKVCAPALVLHGDFDPVPEKYAEEIHLALPNSEYRLIGRSGHFVYVEQPYTTHRYINEFLDKLTLNN